MAIGLGQSIDSNGPGEKPDPASDTLAYRVGTTLGFLLFLSPVFLFFALIVFFLLGKAGMGFGGHGGYGRLVAWIEKKYGKIDPSWSSSRAASFMGNVLSQEQSRLRDTKKLAGLQKYVQQGKYRGLLKNA